MKSFKTPGGKPPLHLYPCIFYKSYRNLSYHRAIPSRKYLLLKGIFLFTNIFAQRSQPSSPHSGGYLHGHGCRKDIRSYGRSWSNFGTADRAYIHFQFLVTTVVTVSQRKIHSPHSIPDPWLCGSVCGSLLYYSRSDNVRTESYHRCTAPRNVLQILFSQSELHPLLHGSGSCCTYGLSETPSMIPYILRNCSTCSPQRLSAGVP